MATVLTTEDWSFEGPDYEVGIFGVTVVHESCTAVSPDGEVQLAEEIGGGQFTQGGQVVVTTTFRCPACEATTSVQESYPADDFEAEPDYQGH